MQPYVGQNVLIQLQDGDVLSSQAATVLYVHEDSSVNLFIYIFRDSWTNVQYGPGTVNCWKELEIPTAPAPTTTA